MTWDSDRLKTSVWLICPKRRTILLIIRASFPRNCLQIHREANNQSKGVNASVQIHPRVTPSRCVCYHVSTDDHQSTAAVLCPAGQELPLLLREGEDSEYCCVTTLNHLWFRERANPLKVTALCVEGINILAAAAHLCTLTSVVFSHVAPFTTFIQFLTLSRLL